MRCGVVALGAILGVLSAAQADETTVRRLDGSRIAAAEIDRTVTRAMVAAQVTGVGIAIFNDGRVAYEKTYGWRDAQARLPLTPDSVMTAASLSKAAFATMVMQLVDEHVLELDKPIVRYLPQPLGAYENYREIAADPRAAKITARMLLAHTSSLPNWRWIEDDKRLRIHFAPGSRFAYSGEGIDLLQLVVETITHEPLAQLMRERIFAPFDMQRSSMVWEPRFEDDHVVEYDEHGVSLGTQRRKHADAAGGMQTTLHDYARFVLAALHGEGLSRAAREQMFAAQIVIDSKHEFPTFEKAQTVQNRAIALSYGLGWGLYKTPYGRAIFKEGHDDGLRHYVVYFDKPCIGLLIMTNSANGESIYPEVLETLIRNTFTPLEWERFVPHKKAADTHDVPAVG